MPFQRLLLIFCIVYFFEIKCFTQKSLFFEGLQVNRSSSFPLSQVKTNLYKVKNWGDSIVELEASKIDTLGSLKYEISELSTSCKTLIFKEMTYVNILYWNFKNSDTQIILAEIYFKKPEKRKLAYFFMQKNKPKYELHMVGSGYYDWFMFEDYIYLIQLNHNEGAESDIGYLAKAKKDFIKLLGH